MNLAMPGIKSLNCSSTGLPIRCFYDHGNVGGESSPNSPTDTSLLSSLVVQKMLWYWNFSRACLYWILHLDFCQIKYLTAKCSWYDSWSWRCPTLQISNTYCLVTALKIWQTTVQSLCWLSVLKTAIMIVVLLWVPYFGAKSRWQTCRWN